MQNTFQTELELRSVNPYHKLFLVKMISPTLFTATWLELIGSIIHSVTSRFANLFLINLIIGI
jgi:hypothetical protein